MQFIFLYTSEIYAARCPWCWDRLEEVDVPSAVCCPAPWGGWLEVLCPLVVSTPGETSGLFWLCNPLGH